jgi:hypothetical protein
MMKNWTSFWANLERKYQGSGSDLWEWVPRDFNNNVDWRKEVHKRCRLCPKTAKAIRLACRDDFKFWLLGFGWLLEPRRVGGDMRIPFLPWDCQLRTSDVLVENLGITDLLFDKSRAMGATWLVEHVFYHSWAFQRNRHFGLVSRNAEAVDNPDDPDALMQKLDYIWKMQPSYLRPKILRASMRMTNAWTGSTFMGYAATGDVARGGRKFAFLMDEMGSWKTGHDAKAMASTQHVTNSRFIVSTIPGPHGEYYRLRESCLHDMDKPAVLVELDWKDVPERRKGLYTSENGQLVKIDPDYQFPSDYRHILDGRIRSPYYDNEWRRSGGSKKQIARELDRDAASSGDGFFDMDKLEEHLRFNARPPLQQYRVDMDEDRNWTISPANVGALSLWVPYSQTVAMDGEYAIGCDISAGTGTSLTNYSVAHIVNVNTGEQVGEYVSNRVSPVVFAEHVYALAKAFNGAYVNFESNGYGVMFKQRLVDQLGYHYVRRDKDERKKKTKRGDRLGWYNSQGGLERLFGPWEHGMLFGKHTLRSAALIKEAKAYQYKNGEVTFVESGHEVDESEKGTAHGDRVVAAALAYMAMTERKPVVEQDDFAAFLGMERPERLYKNHFFVLPQQSSENWANF